MVAICVVGLQNLAELRMNVPPPWYLKLQTESVTRVVLRKGFYLEAMQLKQVGRGQFSISRGGRMGHFPYAVQPGDQISIISEAEQIFILPKTKATLLMIRCRL